MDSRAYQLEPKVVDLAMHAKDIVHLGERLNDGNFYYMFLPNGQVLVRVFKDRNEQGENAMYSTFLYVDQYEKFKQRVNIGPLDSNSPTVEEIVNVLNIILNEPHEA